MSTVLAASFVAGLGPCTAATTADRPHPSAAVASAPSTAAACPLPERHLASSAPAGHHRLASPEPSQLAVAVQHSSPAGLAPTALGQAAGLVATRHSSCFKFIITNKSGYNFAIY